MPVGFRQAVKEVALWEDVVEAMDGQPYRLMGMTGMSSIVIADARNRGFFCEGLSWRILKATNNRLRLTPYGDVQSRLKQQAKQEQNVERTATNK